MDASAFSPLMQTKKGATREQVPSRHAFAFSAGPKGAETASHSFL